LLLLFSILMILALFVEAGTFYALTYFSNRQRRLWDFPAGVFYFWKE
jgi:hypothetical protein